MGQEIKHSIALENSFTNERDGREQNIVFNIKNFRKNLKQTTRKEIRRRRQELDCKIAKSSKIIFRYCALTEMGNRRA